MPGDEKRCVLIALTEQGPVRQIWQTLLDLLSEGNDSEVVALFVTDDRWDRAASLPFTREVLLISGSSRDFTPQMAREIVHETAAEIRSELEALAAEAGYRFTFEIVPTGDQTQVEQLTSGTVNVVIVSSELAGSPLHSAFEKICCDIVLVPA